MKQHGLRVLAIRAKQATHPLALLEREKKKNILLDVARQMIRSSKEIQAANQRDLIFARKKGLSEAMQDRLRLNEKRIKAMAQAVRDVALLPDPIGIVLRKWRRPNGLQLEKVSVPLGVILIIYESRPNVTSECASLCFKSGNSVILRGGREAYYSNHAIARVFRQVYRRHGIPEACCTVLATTDRSAIDHLLGMSDHINLVIPRGGEALIRRVAEKSKIPVIKHYKGICHVYIDSDADTSQAVKIAVNAKCQRPSVCNAMETLLVHKGIANKILPILKREYQSRNCELRGDARTRTILGPTVLRATEADWNTEYLDYILSIRVVNNVDQAIDHIRRYGSAHTDAIVSRNKKTISRFVQEVDSSSVMVNASTRFSDGNEYGFGAEMGISTDKIHARGPMGLEGLTSYKYIVRGKGHIRT